VPAGVPHDIKTSDKGLRIMAVYVVEDGKPVATPEHNIPAAILQTLLVATALTPLVSW
jgi:hypothetical protein